MKRESNQDLSGNEVHYTNSLTLLVKNMLRGKRHYQKEFDSIAFSYEMLTMMAELRPLLAPHMGMKVKRRYQTVLSNYLDLYHKLPDFR